MKTQVEEKYSEFYEKWVGQLEEINEQLLNFSPSPSKNNNNEEEEPPPPELLEALISRATTHYKNFYTAKWVAAQEDVLAFFAPVWLTPLENAHLWFTGWKPSLAFRLLRTLGLRRGGGMTEEQGRKVEELRGKIRVEEEKVERQMEVQQVSMAVEKWMLELARVAAWRRSSRISREEEEEEEGRKAVVVKALLVGLEKVVRAADCVRLRTLKGVLEVLSPWQRVDFLATSATLHMELRKYGAAAAYNIMLDFSVDDSQAPPSL